MKFTGKVHLFGDNILCDHIVSGEHISKNLPMKELVPFLMHDIDPDFIRKFTPGDILVAGDNFGCGSTREHAVLVMKEAGVKCIVAKYFSRSFYRNGINQGIAMVESDWRDIPDGSTVEVDLQNGTVTLLDNGLTFHVAPWPPIMEDIFMAGGLIDYYNREIP